MTTVYMEGERKRASNFSINEKTLLLNIIHKFKSVIENKKTNSTCWREKDEAWQKITEMFNAQSTNTFPRTKDALRKFYDNIKKNVRKEVADERKEIFKTGGGVIQTVPNPIKDLTLGLINSKTVLGLFNEFDCDHNDFNEEIEKENSDSDLELSTMEHTEHSYAKTRQNAESFIVNEPSTSQQSQHFNNLENKIPNTSQSSESGKTKRARIINIEKPKSECLKSPWMKRRRPAIQQLPSSKLSEEYLTLAKLKNECFQAEKENIDAREKREGILFELQKKKILLEIEIEAEKLKQLKKNNDSF